MTTPLVCIVDDAADYRFLLQQVFNRCFPAYTVALFAGGKAFLDALPQLGQLPSLILLDCKMPGLDGYQTLIRLKEYPAYKQIPVVMMSADAIALEINACYEAGADKFLRKPMAFDSLKEQITVICQYWLETKQKTDEEV